VAYAFLERFDADPANGVDEPLVRVAMIDVRLDQSRDDVGLSAAANEGPMTLPSDASFSCAPPIETWYHSAPLLSTPRTPMWPM
jgi:hypothetical protein